MKTYYYIHRIGGETPKIKHNTLAEAELESLRLAERHPNASFEILQCLGTTRMSKPSTFWVDGVRFEYRMLEEGEVIEDGDEYTRGDDIWLKSYCGGSIFCRASFGNPAGHFPHRRKLK